MSIRPIRRGRASVIPTCSAPLRAGAERLFDRLAQAWVRWRRQRHDARYLGYLDAPALESMRVDRPTLAQLGASPRAWPAPRQGFPF